MNSLSLLPSNGTAGTSFALPSSPAKGQIAWQVVPVGTPSALSNALQVSMDGTNWFQADTDATATGCYRVVADVVARFVRIYHTSHTGGTGLTATILLK